MCELNLNKRVKVILSSDGAMILNNYNTLHNIGKNDYVGGDVFETQFYKIPDIFGNKPYEKFIKHIKTRNNGYRKNKRK